MKKIVLIILLSLAITGCTKPKVNYNEMFDAPTAEINNNELIIKGGASRVASTSYVVPHARIKEDKIYIYGTLSLQDNIEKKMKLPKEEKDWKIWWINKDGSLIEMKN